MLVTTTELMLEKLIETPQAKQDLIANANTVILMGKTRQSDSMGRRSTSPSIAAALAATKSCRFRSTTKASKCRANRDANQLFDRPGHFSSPGRSSRINIRRPPNLLPALA